VTVIIKKQEAIVQEIQPERVFIELDIPAAVALRTIARMVGGPPKGYSRHFRALDEALSQSGVGYLDQKVFAPNTLCVYFK
jgi:hypothetical protein